MNWASLMLGAVLIYTGVSWIVSARNWFKGPKSQVSEEEVANMELSYKAQQEGGAAEMPKTDAIAVPVNEV